MPMIECNSQELWHRAWSVQVGDPFNLWWHGSRPIVMVIKEAHSMKAFLRLGPFVIILRVRIGLRKAHDHSLFMHPSCMFNVYICDMYIEACYVCMWYIYGWMYVSMQCMYEIYIL